MTLISTAADLILLLLLALHERMSQVTAQPIRRPMTGRTAASHTGTLSEQSGVRGWAMLCVVELSVLGAAVVVEVGKLFTLVKMYGCS